MFVLMVKEMMLQKGIKPTPFHLEKIGIGRAVAARYLAGKAKSIKLEDLYRLCYHFKCTPKELLRVTATADDGLENNHPLAAWTMMLTAFPLDDFRNFSPSQMTKMQQMLEDIKREG